MRFRRAKPDGLMAVRLLRIRGRRGSDGVWSMCLNMGHAIELMFDICLEVGYC
jgi:hypothetical protein